MLSTSSIPRPTERGLLWGVLAWAVAYGGLRVGWAVGDPPRGPYGSDLVGFTGWWAVLLCVTAGGVAVAVHRATVWRPFLAAGAWAAAGALVAAACVLLPELVGLLLLSPGPYFDPLAFASRLACVSGAVLLGLATAGYQRRTRGDCGSCCRTGTPARPRTEPARWARWAAYTAVAGLTARFAAQFVVGFDPVPDHTPVFALEIGMLLAGVLLPMALVHRWGRIWPAWVPLLAGRTIPRLLLLVPGFGLGAGLVAYFGMGFVQLAATGSASQFSDTFLVVALSSYCVWGLGLAAASTDYHLRTRRACAACDR